MKEWHSNQKTSLVASMCRRWFATFLLVGVASFPASGQAKPPDYVLLWRPVVRAEAVETKPPKRYSNVRYDGQHGYAYGWFGVQRRRHRVISHGYYGNYTQWTFR